MSSEDIFDQALAHFEKGEYGKSVHVLNALLKEDPDDLDALFLRARCLLLTDHLAESLQDLDRLIESVPDFIDGRLTRALLLEETGENERSMSDAETVLEQDSECVPALSLCGRIHYRLDRYDQALECLNRAIESRTEPNFLDYYYRAQTFLCLENPQAAAQDFAEVLRLDPDHNGALFGLACLRAANEEYEEALKLVERAIILYPDDPYYHDRKAEWLAQLGRTPEALAAAENLVEMTSAHPEALLLKARILKDSGDLEGALAPLTLAASHTEADWNVFYLQGVILNVLGRYAQSLEALEAFLKKSPENLPCLTERVSSLLGLRRHAEAEAECVKLMKIEPENASHYNTRAMARAALNRREEAIEDYLKSIQLDPDDVCSYLNLAELYVITHRAHKAADVLHYFSDRFDSLPPTDQLPFAYYDCLTCKLLDRDLKPAEDRLRAIDLKQCFASYYFGDIHQWLEETDLPGEKKDYIRRLTDAFEKKNGFDLSA
ncbi:MAG: tetratricopeptide repeat protein [Verrucomicrobiae bacterium]|nr:tetratricopeptide repeat protein [Verrucomicrobiae bacterium]